MLIAVYGSLRNGLHNHIILKQDINLKFIKTDTLKGFDLYSISNSYPAIIKNDQSKLDIIIEIYELKDKNVFRAILNMELSSGYYLSKINISGLEIYIFILNDITFLQFKKYRGYIKKLNCGDWKEYKLNFLRCKK